MFCSDGGGVTPVRHGEAEPHRLTGAVVRVLPEDHDPHRVERRQLQRVEDAGPRAGRSARRPRSATRNSRSSHHVRPLELVAEHREPALVHPWLHGDAAYSETGRLKT